MKAIEGFIAEPQGFLASGICAGIKASGKEDIAIISSTVPAAVGAVFTQNKMAAAPVLISRKHAQNDYVRAIVINSGCANACTGPQGMMDAQKMVTTAAEELGIDAKEILVSSTGVIGKFLPMDKVLAGIKKAATEISSTGGEQATMAIQTTDTFVKRSAYEFVIGGKLIKIAGIAKGAGMIMPNMATMLTYITTDVAVSPTLLKKMTKEVADKSFNMVVVDGDTSTNDTMVVLANGEARNELIENETSDGYNEFYTALLTVSQDLAKLIARDGEGATKFLEVTVRGGATWEDAKLVAFAIAKSPLVKTAFFGEDPNWGRIVCAAGYSGAIVDPDKVNLFIGGEQIVHNGMGSMPDNTALKTIMAAKDIAIVLDLGLGTGEVTVWTCDFSYEYVKINGEYMT